MNIQDICRRRVVTVQRDDELCKAARLMREHHIGFLVVAESTEREGMARVVGVVTDRDLVVSVMALDLNPRMFRVSDVMTSEPVTVRERDTLEYALAEMRRIGVRRLPVINDCGALAGVIALDDLVAQVARQLDDVAGSIRTEGLVEREIRT